METKINQVERTEAKFHIYRISVLLQK